MAAARNQPALILLASMAVTVPQPLVVWAAITQAVLLAWWTCVYRRVGESPLYALVTPLGAAVVLYIFMRAILRGRRVAWKGREYVSA